MISTPNKKVTTVWYGHYSEQIVSEAFFRGLTPSNSVFIIQISWMNRPLTFDTFDAPNTSLSQNKAYSTTMTLSVFAQYLKCSKPQLITVDSGKCGTFNIANTCKVDHRIVNLNFVHLQMLLM